MESLIDEDQWVWVVVQESGGRDRFLGQYDEENGISFIPCFLEKGEAQEGLKSMVKEEGVDYETQAIRWGYLSSRAAERGFKVFVVNRKGEVLQRK